jgi:GAF domain-containing protein
MGRTPAQSAAARYHRGWSGTGRSDAIRHVVVAIDRYEELLPLAHGSAAVIAELMAAATAHVTLIVDDQFCDVVNVGDLSPGMVTFPEHQYYPLDSYPCAAQQLLAHRGYLSDTDSEVVREYTRQTPYDVPASFLGVPIVAQGRVFGELFLTRNEQQPPFTSEDLELMMDLATVVGGRIPAVLD